VRLKTLPEKGNIILDICIMKAIEQIKINKYAVPYLDGRERSIP
jgi:hypothetical protein